MSDDTRTIEFLIAELAGQLFAFETRQVASALAPRTVTPLPFVPDFVEGLINLNNQVLTLLDLGMLISGRQHDAETQQQRSELLVLETAGVPCAVRVDRVVGKVAVPVEDLDQVAGTHQASDLDAGTESAEGDNVPASAGRADAVATGRFSHEGDSVLTLNADAISALLVPEKQAPGEAGLLGRLASDDEDQQEKQTCLRFDVMGEHYALQLADVVEILDHHRATSLPGAPDDIEGIIALRDEALLVLDLATMLGLSSTAPDTREQYTGPLVIIEVGARRLALRVSRIDGTCEYDEARVRRIEQAASDQGRTQQASAAVTAILIVNDELIGLLTPAALVPAQLLGRIAGFLPAVSTRAEVKAERYTEFLEIRLGNDLVAVPLALVQSVSETGQFEALEQDEQPLVSGAVHLKGEILPVVDYGALLNCSGHTPITARRSDALENSDASVSSSGHNRNAAERNAWVVVNGEGSQWAIPVAEARHIQRIPERAIEALDDSRKRFVDAIAHLENRLLPVLSLKPLDAQAATGPVQ